MSIDNDQCLSGNADEGDIVLISAYQLMPMRVTLMLVGVYPLILVNGMSLVRKCFATSGNSPIVANRSW